MWDLGRDQEAFSQYFLLTRIQGKQNTRLEKPSASHSQARAATYGFVAELPKHIYGDRPEVHLGVFPGFS